MTWKGTVRGLDSGEEKKDSGHNSLGAPGPSFYHGEVEKKSRRVIRLGKDFARVESIANHSYGKKEAAAGADGDVVFKGSGQILVDEAAMDNRLYVESRLVWRHRAGLVWQYLLRPWIVPLLKYSAMVVAAISIAATGLYIPALIARKYGGNTDGEAAVFFFCLLAEIGFVLSTAYNIDRIMLSMQMLVDEWDINTVKRRIRDR